MNKYPVCIVSKDRADICTTHNLLEPYGIKYFYMVEPQDYNGYVERFGKDKVVNIGANDKGIYYVRNFCIEWSKEQGYEKHWQEFMDYVTALDKYHKTDILDWYPEFKGYWK
ncbi:MAG: hypothetical protein EBY39_13130 [Flavobacteriia bacterium]|nr:hypothetical protein [Flavobacteriia bacterium]